MFLVIVMPKTYALEPLERAPVSSPSLVNAFGNRVIEHLNVNQQVQITADIRNNQNVSQDFVYIVQIKDNENVIISVGWITGSLEAGQLLSPALSWIPTHSGTFLAEIFVWESLSNQDALSKSVSIKIITS